MAITKLSKPSLRQVEAEVDLDTPSTFDFGEPEIITVQVSDTVELAFREPTAEDAMKLSEFQNKNKTASDIEATLFTICLLHYPLESQQRLTMKDAKRLSTRQLKKIGSTLNQLMGGGEEDDSESKSDS